jgi:signal transduction histidine kinase
MAMRSPVREEATSERSAGTRLKDLVAAEQLRLVFAKGAYPQLTSIINAFLYSTVVWNLLPHARVAAWFALITVLAGSRIVEQRLYSRAARDASATRRWARINTVGAALHGIAWGLASVMVYPPDSLGPQMLLLLLTGGMAAGASALSASHQASYLAYAIPNTLPLTIRLLAQPDWFHRVMGIVLVIFVGFMSALARSSSRMSREAAELRFKLAELNQVAARRADELEQFAGRVAHDILGPLSATKVALAYAAAHNSDAGTNRMLERGLRSVTRVATIVDGLLRFARAGARPEPGVFTSVRPILSSLVAELEPVAVEAETELVLAPVPECAVVGNPGVLTSLVENLVRNAIKFMGERATKRVMVRVLECDGSSHSQVRFEVEDTGPGIAPELLCTLFDPHVRGVDTEQPGIGLGLATVKRISEAHGGHAGVQSMLGTGSTFWFELPRWPDARRDIDLATLDLH